MKTRQISSWVMLAAAFAFFIALPFVRPTFPMTQGVYVGKLIEKRGTVTYRASQTWLIGLQDGRGFWVSVAPAKAALNGAPIEIEVRCKTETFERCSARYLAH